MLRWSKREKKPNEEGKQNCCRDASEWKRTWSINSTWLREEDVGAGKVHTYYLICKYAKCIDKNI